MSDVLYETVAALRRTGFDMSIPAGQWVGQVHEAQAWAQRFLQTYRRNNGLGIDTETTGLDRQRDRVVVWSLSDGTDRICMPGEFIGLLRESILENPNIAFNGTNIGFDAHMFANSGADISKAGEWRDTKVMSFLRNENNVGRHGLKESTKDHFNRTTPHFKEVFGSPISQLKNKKGIITRQAVTVGDLVRRRFTVPTPPGNATDEEWQEYEAKLELFNQACDYASLDAYNSNALTHFFDMELDGIGLNPGYTLKNYFYAVEVPFTKVLWKMERRGITVDRGHLEEQRGPMLTEMTAIEMDFNNLFNDPINLDSVHDVRRFFFEILKKDPIKFTDGGTTGNRQPSVDFDVLDTWAGQGDPWAQRLLRFRSISKIFGTYIEGLEKWIDPNYRIHTSLNQIGTVTMRLSSSEPNLQNIPRPGEDPYKIREAFTHGPNMMLVVADYKQLEMRLMAHFSQDQKMIDAIKNGIDLHCLTVAEMYGIPYDDVNSAKEAEDLVKSGKRGPLTTREEELLFFRQAAKACVHPDTVVRLNGKTRTAIEGIASYTSGRHGANDLILPLAGVSVGDGRGSDIPALYAYPVQTKDGVHVLTRRGALTCSFDHKFKLADGRLVEASQLRVGDELPETIVPLAEDSPYAPLKYKLFKGTPPVFLELNHQVAYFAGVFAGDGYQSGAHTLGIAHGPIGQIDDTGLPYEEWQRSILLSAHAVGLDTIAKPKKVYLGSRHTQLYFNALGLMSGNQKRLRVPDWVLQAGRTSILHFLGGLIDTDGTVDKRSGGLSITTKDPIFAGQLCTAIRSAGVRVALEPNWNSTYERYYYRVRVPTADAYLIQPFMKHRGKTARIRFDVRSLTQQKNIVTLVESAGPIPCFDITVGAEDHLYMTNGLLTHNTGFGIIYGIGGPHLAANLTKELHKLVTEREGCDLIRKWFAVFPGVEDYIDRKKKDVEHYGFVQTLVGRYRRFGDLKNMRSNVDRARELRQSVNSIIQGSASDLAKKAMLIADTDPELKECGAVLLLQIHDELILECPDDPEIVKRVKTRIKEIMAHPFDRELLVPIPASCSSGDTWAAAK
jgi:DNA polymerase I-like protein with 3'-5' exonuclease and polymerase domains